MHSSLNKNINITFNNICNTYTCTTYFKRTIFDFILHYCNVSRVALLDITECSELNTVAIHYNRQLRL